MKPQVIIPAQPRSSWSIRQVRQEALPRAAQVSTQPLGASAQTAAGAGRAQSSAQSSAIAAPSPVVDVLVDAPLSLSLLSSPVQPVPGSRASVAARATVREARCVVFMAVLGVTPRAERSRR